MCQCQCREEVRWADCFGFGFWRSLLRRGEEDRGFGLLTRLARWRLGSAMAEELDSERFVLRALAPTDIHKGFMQLLGQLTVAGDVSETQFAERLQYLQRLGDDHHVAVIEDVETSQIVATGSVLIEHKFVRNCGKAGHIEDVVVDKFVRGQHLGKRIIERLTSFAKDKGCYKVILDCTAENAPFYEKCGYARKEIQMAQYF